jgi:multidrug efflux pump subunit AcrB
MIPLPKGLGVFAWKRLILAVAALLAVNGLLRWFTTPQEEDPQLAPRQGIITVIFPGAVPRDMERLISKPIEDELAQVESVKTTMTTIRTDFLFMQVKLKDALSTESDTQNAWDKVQDALDRAEKKLPETASKPLLDKEMYDQDAVFLAVSGGKDRLAILDEARGLKDRLQSIPSVKKIDQICPPGEQLSVVFNHDKLTKFGVSLENLLRQLKGGNAVIASGYVEAAGRKVSVLTNSFYASPDELAHFPVILKSGDILPLSEIATIARTPFIPVHEAMRYNGAPAMGLGVVAQHNVNLERFGEAVRGVVKEFAATDRFKASGLKIDEVSFQPRYVKERIIEIGLDLVKAIFLVGGVLMLMLGLRVGSIVAMQVPIVTVIAFGIFSLSGGVLNQVSIAAFILAIGLLVDNVVVIVDGMQDKLDRGLTPVEAGERTRKEYLIPLAAGTMTTAAAFLPILTSKGVVSDFTRAVGIVAAIALLCSYVFCIFVTPILAAGLLEKGKARRWLFIEPLGARMGNWVERFPKIIIAAAVAAVAAAVLGFGLVKKQFFPFADRDLVIVDMRLPEGTHYKSTELQALRVEREIARDPRVASVTTVIGRGVPPFYYNLPREPNAPHIAQFIVRTKTKEDAGAFKKDEEDALQALVPFGTLMVKEISQGPIIRAPIEVRIFSNNPRILQEAAERTLAAVRRAAGVCKVRSTMGMGMMNYRLDVNDTAAGNFGVSRAEVSTVILATTRGVPITTYRGADEPYSISLMSTKGEDSRLEDIQAGYIGSTRTDNISIGTLTNKGIEFSPSVLEHRDRSPVVYVYGEIAPGSSESVATKNVRACIAGIGRIAGARIEMGGTFAESSEANAAIFRALPLGLFVLLISLLIEFNSFRRIGIILMTIPLCAVGAVPGLILSRSTFGFMTMLGFFTLAGTVIHNGIFLLDYIDHRIHDGVPLREAITEGIQRRTRPIILTAVATIVELLPMTMSSATLWPPFAWAIISGLSVSTLMTLLVIPAIYKVVFEKEMH